MGRKLRAQTLYLLCSVLLLVWTTPASALDSATLMATLQKNHLKPEDTGVIVLEGNRMLLGLNEAKKMKPASLTKVITGSAALELLGPAYEFRTQLLYDGSMMDHDLRGTLFLKGGGDPSFLSTKLSILISALDRLKITTIEGNLIVDDSRFQEIRSPGWYSQISNINPKMFPLFLNVDPPAGLVPYSRPWVEIEKGRRKMIDLEGRFVVYQNITEPDLWTGYQLKQLIAKKGIKIKGLVVHGKTSESARVLAEVITPLPTVIRKMMKASNNYYADMLIQNLPIRFGEKQGKFEDGMEFLKYYLDHVKISRDEYSLNSGSGFSHRNSITPRAIAKLLNHLRNEKDVSPYFLASLPIAGVDGTLAGRMNKTAAKGHVLAKTGYLRPVRNSTTQLNGAVTLAGFVYRLDGKILTFAFLYNGTADPAIVRRTFDQLCVDLMKITGTVTAQMKKNSARK